MKKRTAGKKSVVVPVQLELDQSLVEARLKALEEAVKALKEEVIGHAYP